MDSEDVSLVDDIKNVLHELEEFLNTVTENHYLIYNRILSQLDQLDATLRDI